MEKRICNVTSDPYGNNLVSVCYTPKTWLERTFLKKKVKQFVQTNHFYPDGCKLWLNYPDRTIKGRMLFLDNHIQNLKEKTK